MGFMKWPKGKYNGLRIDGFSISITLHLLWWVWAPIISMNFGEPYLVWLCISVRLKLNFEF